MAKTIFEQMGGTYTIQGDYCLPDLALLPEEKRPIGVWAHRRRQYLKQHHKILYCNLLTSGKLYSYLADVEECRGRSTDILSSAGKRIRRV